MSQQVVAESQNNCNVGYMCPWSSFAYRLARPLVTTMHGRTQTILGSCAQTGSLFQWVLCRINQCFVSESKVSPGTMSMVFMSFIEGTEYPMNVVFLCLKRRSMHYSCGDSAINDFLKKLLPHWNIESSGMVVTTLPSVPIHWFHFQNLLVLWII